MLFSSVQSTHEAEKVIKHGAIAGYVSAGITAALVIYTLTIGGSSFPSEFVSVNNLVDAVIIFILAIGVHRKSRAASLLLIAVFILSKISFLITNDIRPSFGSVVFIYFFGRAAYGTFVYHRLVTASDDNPSALKRTLQWGGGVLTTLFLALIGYGLLTETAIFPSTQVLTGDSMPRGEIEELLAAGIVQPDERILYFYSDHMYSVSKSGSVLTNSYVITYYTTDEGELEIFELPLKEVTKIERLREGSFLEDSQYQIFGETRNQWLRLWLPQEAEGDIKFISAIREAAQ